MLYNFEKKLKAYDKLRLLIGLGNSPEITSHGNDIYTSRVVGLFVTNEFPNGENCDELEVLNFRYQKQDGDVCVDNWTICHWQFINFRTDEEILAYISMSLNISV